MATAGDAVSIQLTASGYPSPTFSLDGGSLPTGLSLSSAGLITGTAAASSAGTWKFTVEASNSTSSVTQVDTMNVGHSASYTGSTSTGVGTGAAGIASNGTAAQSAPLDGPSSIVLDGAGDRFILNTTSSVVQEIPATTQTVCGTTMTAGDVYTVAGDGISGYAGDSHVATSAELNHPQAIAIDPTTGTLYIADTGNDVVRAVPFAAGEIDGNNVNACDIYTVAGTAVAGYYGDGGAATLAKLSSPAGIAVDSLGDVFVSDSGNNEVREIAATTLGGHVVGDIYAAVGSSTARNAPSTTGAAASSVVLSDPTSLAVVGDDDLYIADSGANEVLGYALSGDPMLTNSVTTGDVYLVGGTGSPGTSGNGGAATSAQFDDPMGIVVDGAGNIYVTDPAEGDLRVIANTDSSMFGVAMTIGDVYQIDGSLTDPTGAGVDSSGAISIAEESANEIEILGVAPTITSATTGSCTAGATSTVIASATGEPVPTFTESGTLPSGVTLASDGQLTCDPALGTAGSYAVTLYATNGIGTAASQTFTLTVAPATTSEAVSVSPTTPLVSQTSTVTVQVSPAPGTDQTLSISDDDGYFDCAAAPISVSGVATCTSSIIRSAGQDTVTASFGGDGQYAGSSNTLTFSAAQAPTTVSLSSSPPSMSALTTPTLTATVSPVPNGGTVAFSDSQGYVSGCGAVTVNTTTGEATCVTAQLSAPGPDTFSAQYSGDGSFLQSSTSSLPETIGKAVTSVVITTVSTPTANEQTTVYATVTDPDGNPVTSGTISFGDTAGLLPPTGCANRALDDGKASCTLSAFTSVSPDTVTAAYLGTSLYAPGSGTASLTPGLFPTSLAMAVSTGELEVGHTSVITATLNQPSPTGTVAFSDTAGLIAACSAVVPVRTSSTSSAATCTTSAPVSDGSDSVTATYSGDALDSSVSQTTTYAIDTAPSISSATAFTITAGDNFTTQVTTTGSPSVIHITDASVSAELPPGLALTDDGNGVATITGTVSSTGGGTYVVDLALDDGTLGTVTVPITFTVNQAPSFSTASSGTCVANTACSITVTTVGYPAASLGEAVALPSGLSFHDDADGSASILGTPTDADVGTVTFPITATNGIASAAVQDYSLAIVANPTIPTPQSTGGGTPGSGSSGGSSSGGPPSSGSSGASSSGATPSANQGTAAKQVLASYEVTGMVQLSASRASTQTITCLTPSSSIIAGKTNNTLTSLGFTPSIKCSTTEPVRVKNAKGTLVTVTHIVGGKRVPEVKTVSVTIAGSMSEQVTTTRLKHASGKVMVVRKLSWVGGFDLTEPTQHLELMVTPASVTASSTLVLSVRGTIVVPATPGVAVRTPSSGSLHSVRTTSVWTFTPVYTAAR